MTAASSEACAPDRAARAMARRYSSWARVSALRVVAGGQGNGNEVTISTMESDGKHTVGEIVVTGDREQRVVRHELALDPIPCWYGRIEWCRQIPFKFGERGTHPDLCVWILPWADFVLR